MFSVFWGFASAWYKGAPLALEDLKNERILPEAGIMHAVDASAFAIGLLDKDGGRQRTFGSVKGRD